MEGPLPDSARPGWLCWRRHGRPGNRRNAAPRLVRGHHRVRARLLSGCGTRRSMGPARRVPGRGCGNAGRTVTGRALERTATRGPYRVRMSMIGRLAAGTRAASPVKRRKHRCLLARSHPHRVLASGVPGESRKPGALICRWLPAPVRGLLTGCVCISLWITCAKRHQACVYAVEILGIPLLGRAGKGAFNWEDMNPRPVHAEESSFVHTPRRESRK